MKKTITIILGLVLVVSVVLAATGVWPFNKTTGDTVSASDWNQAVKVTGAIIGDKESGDTITADEWNELASCSSNGNGDGNYNLPSTPTKVPTFSGSTWKSRYEEYYSIIPAENPEGPGKFYRKDDCIPYPYTMIDGVIITVETFKSCLNSWWKDERTIAENILIPGKDLIYIKWATRQLGKSTGPIEFGAVIGNKGSEAIIEPFKVLFYTCKMCGSERSSRGFTGEFTLDEILSTGGEKIGETTINGLEAFEMTVASICWTPPPVPSGSNVFVFIDPDNKIKEKYENNNVGADAGYLNVRDGHPVDPCY